jgi:hypothetical protein
VMLLVSNLRLKPNTVLNPVQTTSVAPAILKVLGIEPNQLEALRKDKTGTLPGLSFSENYYTY